MPTPNSRPSAQPKGTGSPSWGYVGPSWGYVGPSWGYVGASWGYVGQPWGYVGPSWGYVGPSWGYVGPFWGLCWPILGLCWPNMDAFWNLSWAMLAHLEPQKRKSRKRKKHCKTRDFRGSAAKGGGPFLLLRKRRCLRQSHGYGFEEPLFCNKRHSGDMDVTPSFFRPSKLRPYTRV